MQIEKISIEKIEAFIESHMSEYLCFQKKMFKYYVMSGNFDKRDNPNCNASTENRMYAKVKPADDKDIYVMRCLLHRFTIKRYKRSKHGKMFFSESYYNANKEYLISKANSRYIEIPSTSIYHDDDKLILLIAKHFYMFDDWQRSWVFRFIKTVVMVNEDKYFSGKQYMHRVAEFADVEEAKIRHCIYVLQNPVHLIFHIIQQHDCRLGYREFSRHQRLVRNSHKQNIKHAKQNYKTCDAAKKRLERHAKQYNKLNAERSKRLEHIKSVDSAYRTDEQNKVLLRHKLKAIKTGATTKKYISNLKEKLKHDPHNKKLLEEIAKRFVGVSSVIATEVLLEFASIYNVDIVLEHPIVVYEEGYIGNVDCYIPEYNCVIEFFGTYWHCDPRQYNENFFRKDSYAKDVWSRDSKRIDSLISAGYKVCVLWEHDTVVDGIASRKQLDKAYNFLLTEDKFYTSASK